MGIELIAKITHDILPNDIVQVCLPDTYNTRDDRHYKHDGDKNDEQVQVAFADSVIKDIADQEWVDQAQNGREYDGDENQYNLYFICAKGLGDATYSTHVGFAPSFFQFFGIVFQSTAHSMKCHKMSTPGVNYENAGVPVNTF